MRPAVRIPVLPPIRNVVKCAELLVAPAVKMNRVVAANVNPLNVSRPVLTGLAAPMMVAVVLAVVAVTKCVRMGFARVLVPTLVSQPASNAATFVGSLAATVQRAIPVR
jgi:hypothetical protein